MRIGQDIITPMGWGEVVEIFDNGSFLVEFPNRTRKIYFDRDLK
jgi:hypothetical protein